MSCKDASPIGLVGARAYELQAWQSPGAGALEDAYWAARPPAKAPPSTSRLMRLIDAIAATAAAMASAK